MNTLRPRRPSLVADLTRMIYAADTATQSRRRTRAGADPMGWMQSIRRMWRGLPHEPDAALAFDATGFHRDGPEAFVVAWDGIVRISGYRTDLWTAEEVRIDVELASGDEIFFSEESPGFPALMEEMIRRYPSVAGWFERIALAADAPGTIVLYDRATASPARPGPPA